MTNELLNIISKEESNKSKYEEIIEYLTNLFEGVLKNKGIKNASYDKISEIVEKLNENLDYEKATEENLVSYFESLAKIFKF